MTSLLSKLSLFMSTHIYCSQYTINSYTILTMLGLITVLLICCIIKSLVLQLSFNKSYLYNSSTNIYRGNLIAENAFHEKNYNNLHGKPQ